MTDIDTFPLGRAILRTKDRGMEGHVVSAMANATIGLSALANSGAQLPPDQVAEWRAYLDRIISAQDREPDDRFGKLTPGPD